MDDAETRIGRRKNILRDSSNVTIEQSGKEFYQPPDTSIYSLFIIN